MAAEDALELSVILGEPSTSEEHDLSGGYQFLGIGIGNKRFV